MFYYLYSKHFTSLVTKTIQNKVTNILQRNHVHKKAVRVHIMKINFYLEFP